MSAKEPGIGLLFVLIFSMGMAPLVTYSANALSPFIISDLHITIGSFGLFANVSFLSGALFSFLLARASDHLSRMVQLTIIFGGVASAFAVMAMASNLGWLLVAAFMTGPSHALSNPFTNRLIIDRLSAERRPEWVGLKQSGVQLSQAVAGLTFPVLAFHAGWQGIALLASVLCFLLLLWSRGQLLDALSLPDQARPRRRGFLRGAWPPPERDDGPLPPSVRVIAAYALLAGAAMQATNVYLVIFALKEVHVSALVAGLTAGIAGTVGLASRILWGRAMKFGGEGGTLLAVLAVGALFAPLLLLMAGEWRSQPLLWLAVVIHGATALGSNVVIMASVMRQVPAARAGAASSMVALGMYAGFALGPLMMGGIIALSGSFFWGWCVLGLCYGLCLLVAGQFRRLSRSI